MKMRKPLPKLVLMISFIIVISTSACGVEQEQEFTIISGYEGMAAYVEAAKSDSETDLETLFQEHVVDPYWEECAAGGEYKRLAEGAISDPIEDLDGLSEAVNVIAESEIERIVEEALSESAALLEGPDTIVCIFSQDPKKSELRDISHGIRGIAAGAGKIWLIVHPADGWLEWIPYTVAHEYHHSVWTDRHFKWYQRWDLVDSLVFEGKANTFASMVYPGMESPATKALSPAEEARQWEKMQEYLGNTSFEKRREFMHGNRLGSIPRSTGYTIGYHIVQMYLQKHPDMSIDEWTAVDAHEILNESGYSGEQ